MKKTIIQLISIAFYGNLFYEFGIEQQNYFLGLLFGFVWVVDCYYLLEVDKWDI